MERIVIMSMDYKIFKGSLTAGNSPINIDITFGNVERIIVQNLGSGEMVGSASIDNAVSYGDDMRIMPNSHFETSKIAPTDIRLTHVVDTEYQVYIEGSL